MMAPVTLQESSSQLPPRGSRDSDGADIDKFATLFSPVTPHASPTLEASEMKPTPVSRPRMFPSDTPGSDSEFGSFVSVSAMDDPLALLDFDLPPPVRPKTQQETHFDDYNANPSLSFFGKFGHEAKMAAERNKRGVLDELLLHEDDPLYWLKDGSTSGMNETVWPRQEPKMQGYQAHTDASSSILDLDPDFFTTRTPSTPPPQPKVSLPQTPSRSPTLPGPATLAPPIADTTSVSPLDEIHDPLSAPSTSTRPPSSPRSHSYQTMSTLSSRWMSSLLPAAKPTTHSPSPSLESLFAFDTASAPPRNQQRSRSSDRPPAHATTLPPYPAQISHGTPFGRSNKPSPFASHTYTPPTGAPGFAGDRYDWDKGFSAELEHELVVDERKGRDLRGVPGESKHAKVTVSQFMEKKSGSVELSGRKAATTPVLSAALANAIRPYLPALARLPRRWTLLYSLDQHGISLNTLYSRCEAYVEPKIGSPRTPGVLVVVKDTGDAVFGVWMGEDGVHPSRGKGYYGSGETFMWKYVGEKLQVFKWTGKNDYVALCESEYISFGGGDGHYGLYLDQELLEGSSARCPTFENEPLCSPNPKSAGMVNFECVGLEVWGVEP
ncbi:TLD-domain-containing protein [Collybia nuda]|uniref:Oxidation resistance protein 1 n=1 Tax=Collybia nuda TaxID=64659 RepID=A0A9P5Y5V1_9AGAR|nr:TLD-domain-containing protein [Collybia nuda]